MSEVLNGTSAHKRQFSAMQWLKAELGVTLTDIIIIILIIIRKFITRT